MQILDDTSAVLSLGKLYEEHGYIYEWISDQKTPIDQTREEHIMQNEKLRISCYPWIVVRFWSPPSSPQDSSSTSSSPASERSDEPAPGNWRDWPKTQNKNKKKDINRASDDCLRPEWLEEFTDNLEDTEVSASTHISQDSNSKHFAKVTFRKHSIGTHIPKDRNFEICKRIKMTRTPCRRRTD